MAYFNQSLNIYDIVHLGLLIYVVNTFFITLVIEKY